MTRFDRLWTWSVVSIVVLLAAWMSVQGVRAQGPVSICAPSINQTFCANQLSALAGSASAVSSSMVLKATPGTVTGFQVNNTNASSRWVLLFNATAAPSNGAVTGCSNIDGSTACVAKYYQVAGTSGIGVSWAPGPMLRMNIGVVLVCSSTGPFTLTLAADCTFSGEVN